LISPTDRAVDFGPFVNRHDDQQQPIGAFSLLPLRREGDHLPRGGGVPALGAKRRRRRRDRFRRGRVAVDRRGIVDASGRIRRYPSCPGAAARSPRRGVRTWPRGQVWRCARFPRTAAVCRRPVGRPLERQTSDESKQPLSWSQWCSAGPAVARSELDVGAHRHDPVLWQVEGVDRAPRSAREQQEQTLAPRPQARIIAADERDLGD